MNSKYLQVFVAGLLFSIINCATVLAFSTVVTYGDSLSDNGNIARFTDGPVWVELLADEYSATLFDFAYGGATTGFDNPAAGLPVTGLLWQVDTFGPGLATLPSADTLVTLWAGPNDLLQGRDPFNAVSNVGSALESLYNEGGRNFVVPNLPDIGKTPSLIGQGASQAMQASQWTLSYNLSLDSKLSDFSNMYNDINLFTVDIFTIFDQFPVGSQEWRDLFWIDGFHPSSIGHELIFNSALSATEPVPEPATALLFATGLATLIRARRKRQKT